MKQQMKNNVRPIAVLVNDIHITRDNGELVKNVMKQVASFAKKNSIYDIILGGDVFTNRSGQPLQCLIDFQIVLEECFGEFTVHMIPGNHDKTDPDSDKSYLDIYSYMDEVHVYRKARAIDIRGCGFLMIPYFSKYRWIEEFQSMKKRALAMGAQILVTHVAIDGVMNNDGSVVCDEINGSMLKNFKAVLVGHYHNASSISDNIHYTGSAYQANYGEDTVKGFTVIYSDASTKHVKTVFPKYIKHTIEANDKETLRNLLEKYDGTEEDHIRFEFVGKRTDFDNIDSVSIQSHYGIECKFVSDEEKEAISISEDESVLQYSKSDLRKDFIKFCAENKIKGDKLRFGMELIKKLS